jgi:hypothetical protein
MSLLQNPNFESGSFSLPWKKINFQNSVIVNVGSSVGPPPYSGSNVAFVVSQANGGSIGQDVTGVNAPSLSAFAYVSGGPSGSLAIWNLTTNVAVATPFTSPAGSWLLVTNTLDLSNTPNANVRFEIYVNTIGQQLMVDNVNLF